MVAAGANPVSLRNGVIYASSMLAAHVKAIAKPVADNNDLLNIATIASNSPSMGGIEGFYESNNIHFIRFITLYPIYTIYTIYPIYTIHTIYTIYTIQTMYTIYTIYTTYTTHTTYTTYTSCFESLFTTPAVLFLFLPPRATAVPGVLPVTVTSTSVVVVVIVVVAVAVVVVVVVVVVAKAPVETTTVMMTGTRARVFSPCHSPLLPPGGIWIYPAADQGSGWEEVCLQGPHTTPHTTPLPPL